MADGDARPIKEKEGVALHTTSTDAVGMNRYQRAHQLWSVLILAAKNRQILTYAMAGKITGLPPAALGKHLYPIQYYCQQQKPELPPLTVLVVQQDSGLPGEGLMVADFAKSIQEVFNFDWFMHKAPKSKMGPDAEDFQRATEQHDKEI